MGLAGFNPQVPVPEPTGSGNPKAGYLTQPQPTDAGLDFGRHGLPAPGTWVSVLIIIFKLYFIFYWY